VNVDLALSGGPTSALALLLDASIALVFLALAFPFLSAEKKHLIREGGRRFLRNPAHLPLVIVLLVAMSRAPAREYPFALPRYMALWAMTYLFIAPGFIFLRRKGRQWTMERDDGKISANLAMAKTMELVFLGFVPLVLGAVVLSMVLLHAVPK
jgi:hypothetical protein